MPDVVCVGTNLGIICTSWNWKYWSQVGIGVVGRILSSIVREFVTRDSPVGFNIAKVDMNRGPKGVK